ncbi:MAG: dephospho-CoA kinase [Balneolaceae bacterium]
MIVAGITGGIGSGKTAFCKVWEELGVPVLYADPAAKELMESDKELISALKRVFGEEAYGADGRLNRTYLAKEAFEKNRVGELNAIVHPALHRHTRTRIREEEAKGTPLFAKEAAILLNDGRPDYLDLVIVIAADEELRIQRVMERDGVSEQEVRHRMSRQLDQQAMLAHADHVITNNNSPEELRAEAESLYKRILERNL